MFRVIHKTTKVKYTVYDVKYDASGNAHFLIFSDNQFIVCHSKHFKPHEGLLKK